LKGQVVSVAIDDQGWDAVGLAMHPTISGGGGLQVAPTRERFDEPSSPEVFVHGFVLGRDEPQCDLGRIAVERAAQKPTRRILNLDDVSGRRGVCCPHIGAVDPEVTPENALSPTLTHSDYRHDMAPRVLEGRTDLSTTIIRFAGGRRVL
jgi:hypothetical protein